MLSIGIGLPATSSAVTKQPPQAILRQADDLIEIERRGDLPVAVRIGVVAVVGQGDGQPEERIDQ